MASPAGIVTTQISQSNQIHLVVDAKDSYKPTDLEEPGLPAIPAATEVLQNNNPDMTQCSLGGLEGEDSHIDARKLEGQLENTTYTRFKSQSDSTGILVGEDNISQTRVRPVQDLALQQDLAPTRRVFDVPHREIDSESIKLRADLQSALRRVIELERRMRDNRFLRRERIQLGLDISVAGERRVSVSGFPFMVVLALIVVIIPIAYKYYAFRAQA